GGEAGLPHGESAGLPSPARTISGLDRRSRLLRNDGRVVRAELNRQSEVVAVARLLDRNQVGGADLEAQRSVVTGVILSDVGFIGFTELEGCRQDVAARHLAVLSEVVRTPLDREGQHVGASLLILFGLVRFTDLSDDRYCDGVVRVG